MSLFDFSRRSAAPVFVIKATMASLDFARTPPTIGAMIANKTPVTCLSFHEDGNHLFAASGESSSVRLIDCQKGMAEQPATRCEKDGATLVEATHHNYSVLLAGEGTDVAKHNVTYLSLYDNKILRSFGGHTDRISGLSMSPVDDSFLSSSAVDRSARLWDIRQSVCVAKVELPITAAGLIHATFDKTGLVFGVASALPGGAGNVINLYDARNYSDGPFADFQVDGTTLHKSIMQKGLPVDVASVLSAAEWTSIEFNTSGKQMLVAAKQGLAIMLDGFNGSITQIFVASTVSYDKVGAVASHSNDGLAACFSYDDRFVLGGCEDGTIHCWNASSGNLLNKLEGHKSRVGCIAANPKFAMMASSCTNTALWVW